MAYSKGQDQGYAHFDNEYLENGKWGKKVTLPSISK